MYNRFELGIRYLRYFFTASNGKGHGTHSPFVYTFIDEVLRQDSAGGSTFKEIEHLRRQYKNDKQTVIEVKDLGAGSFTHAGSKRAVAEIAKGAAKPAKFARLLHNMVRFYQIDSVLELGTSLGLTTRYLSLSHPTHGVQTIEGAPGIAQFTSAAFIKEGVDNVNLLVGDFEEQLPVALGKMKGRKLVFFDGNHQYAPTKQYFEMVLSVCNEQDILIFDDIHWSIGMEKAWQEIKKNERVTCSIDLFFIGIVFLRKEFKEKLDFTIRF